MRTHRHARRLEQNRRLSVLQHMMTSFAITAVVVVTVVFAMPARLSGTIEYLEVIETALYYQVRLDDPETHLASDSFYLRLEHPLDRREIPLEHNMQAGVVEGLRPNSRYTVTLHASQGYGDEVLSRKTIDTADQPDGVIAGVFFEEDLSRGSWFIEAIVLVSDFAPFSSMAVEMTWRHEIGFSDQVTETVGIGYNAVTLERISLGFSGTIEMRLIGYDETSSEIEIDHWEGDIPYAVYASFYLEDHTQNTLLFTLYPDETLTDAVYTAYLYYENQHIDQHTFSFKTQEGLYRIGSHRFARLKSHTVYTVALWVSYTDPYTDESVWRMLTHEIYQTEP